MHIIEGPNFENRNGIQHFNVDNNPNVLYALVNKPRNRDKDSASSTDDTLKQHCATPLGKILHDSLKYKRPTSKQPSLSPLPEPSGDEVTSYSSPTSLGGPLLYCSSMNNVRVMEHHSPPKRPTHLSKSNLSLYRSEIFLENLCRSEPLADNYIDAEQEKLMKTQNVSIVLVLLITI